MYHVRRLIAQAEDAAVGLLMAGMAVMLAAQVVFRYVLNSPLAWTEELSRLSVVWLTFIGAAIATREGSHITVRVFRNRPKSGWGRIHRLFVGAVVVGCTLVLVVGSLALIRLQANSRTPALELPVPVFTWPVLVSAVLVSFHLLESVTGRTYGEGEP